jgi:hypothetical protein
MKNRLHPRLIIGRVGRLPLALGRLKAFEIGQLPAPAVRRSTAFLVIVVLAVLSWYAPAWLVRRHEPMSAGAIRAVAVDREASFLNDKKTEPLPVGAGEVGQLIGKNVLWPAFRTWHAVGDARVQERDNKLFLSLDGGILTSAPFRLHRGNYELVVSAKTRVGGLQFGIASARSNLCAANAFLQSKDIRRYPMILTVRRSGDYYLVFRSWPVAERTVAVVDEISVRDTSELMHAQAAASYFHSRASTPLKVSSGSVVLAHWSLAPRIPSNWTIERGVKTTQKAGGVLIRTRRDADYTLVSPTVFPDPAVPRYIVTVRGRVLYGGLTVWVLDVKPNRFLAHGSFWFGQRGPYVFTFAPAAGYTGGIRLVLSNWTPFHESSRWTLRDVTLSW